MSNTVSNLQHEALFESWNLKYRLIDEINIDTLQREAAAQVRTVANIALPQNVEEYALQMQAGRLFPPVIIWSGMLIDGNTRLAAAKKIGRATYPAYDVELPSVLMAKALAAAINSMNGQRLTPAEARDAALNLIDLDFTDGQIAMTLGVTSESARQWRRIADVGARAERAGVADVVAKMPKSMKMELGKVTHDQPFRDLALAISETRPDVKEVRQAIEQIRDATSDDAAIAAVATARQEWTPVGPQPGKHRPNRAAQQARMHIGGLLKIDPALIVDPAKRDTDLQRWEEVAAMAARVIGLLHQDAAA